MKDSPNGVHLALRTATANLLHNDANRQAFHLNLDVQLPGKGVTAIFGPSGAGKTTLLRCIAGLNQTENGTVVVNGQIWQKPGLFVPPHQRDLGYVFQEASLFPHLSVEHNIQYGLQRRKLHVDDTDYQRLLQILDIEQLLKRLPDKLSGGERQRVAIARALVTKPKLILMDEPLASLDDGLKQQILPWLEELKQLTNIPMLYVTHSLQEVSRLADQVLLLQKGKAVAQGGINEVFSRQAFTKEHGGAHEYISTVINVIATEMDDKWHLIRFSFDDNHLWLANSGEQLQHSYRIRIPASDVSISLESQSHSSILNRLHASIKSIIPCDNPANCLVNLVIAKQPLVAQITQKSVSDLQLTPGMNVWVQIKSAAIIR